MTMAVTCLSARLLPVLLFLTTVVAAYIAAPPPRAAAPRLSIIDVHAHLMGGPRSRPSTGSVDAALDQMNRFGIRKAIVMSPPRGALIASNFDYADFIDAIRRHPRRFAFLGGGGTLNPMLHGHGDPSTVTPETKEKFRRTALAILAAGAAGFGEMSSLHLSLLPTHRYNFVPADHPLFLLLADIAAEYDVPIDLHMDALDIAKPPPARLAGNQNPPILPATLAALTRLLVHNRKAKIVWAHGGSDPLGEMTANLVGGMMDRHANLYMSLRPVPPPAPQWNKLFSPRQIDPQWAKVIARHADRFMIGTDSFFLPAGNQGAGPAATFAQRNEYRLRAANVFLGLLPPARARKLASENAARIYKLSPD